MLPKEARQGEGESVQVELRKSSEKIEKREGKRISRQKRKEQEMMEKSIGVEKQQDANEGEETMRDVQKESYPKERNEKAALPVPRTDETSQKVSSFFMLTFLKFIHLQASTYYQPSMFNTPSQYSQSALQVTRAPNQYAQPPYYRNFSGNFRGNSMVGTPAGGGGGILDLFGVRSNHNPYDAYSMYGSLYAQNPSAAYYANTYASAPSVYPPDNRSFYADNSMQMPPLPTYYPPIMQPPSYVNAPPTRTLPFSYPSQPPAPAFASHRPPSAMPQSVSSNPTPTFPSMFFSEKLGNGLSLSPPFPLTHVAGMDANHFFDPGKGATAHHQ